MRAIIITIVICAILGATIAIVFNSIVVEQPKSYRVNNETELLTKIDKRLERIQEDLEDIVLVLDKNLR